jgi:hypothetical protein
MLVVDITVERQSHIKMRNLIVVQHARRHGEELLQWYVAAWDRTLILGPFSNLEEAIKTAQASDLSGFRIEKSQ